MENAAPSFAFYCVAVYLIFISVVGVCLAKKVKNQEDYAIAGRSFASIRNFGIEHVVDYYKNGGSVPLHSGTIRYLMDKGLID